MTGAWLALALATAPAASWVPQAPAPAPRAEWEASARGVLGLSGGYYGGQTEVARRSPGKLYLLTLGLRTYRYGAAARSSGQEWSASLRRELYHVSISGRLATNPPNLQRSAYHLAAGEMLFTFYGLTLGPEHPAWSAQLWESTSPVPSPDSLDRAWVTRLKTVYTNTNHHIGGFVNMLVVVQNTWQFELSETWRERLTLSVDSGFDLYNRVIANGRREVLLDNIRYTGNAFAVRGWPNNRVGLGSIARLSRSWDLSVGWTRLNLLDNQTEFLYGTELAWRPWNGARAAAGYWRRRRRGVEGREAVSLGLSCLW